MGKAIDKLKKLGTKVNGKEPNGKTIGDVLDNFADDYTGGGGTTYTAGTGIEITNDEISIDEEVVALKSDIPSDETLYDNLILFNNFAFSLNDSNLNSSENFVFGIHIISNENLSNYSGNIYTKMQSYFGNGNTFFTPNILIVENKLQDSNDNVYVAVDIDAYVYSNSLTVHLTVIDSTFTRSTITSQANYNQQLIRSYPIN